MKHIILVVILLLLAGAGFPAALRAHVDVTPQEAQDLIAATPGLWIVDVREESEYCDEAGHIPGALNYPWSSGVLEARYEELPLEGDILVVCRSGNRSNQAAEFLDAQGFSSIYDMLEGMSAWPGNTEACRGAACPAEVLLGDDQAALAELRAFRDDVLLKSRAGTLLTVLYYRHAAEISELIDRNPAIRQWALGVLTPLRPFIKSMRFSRPQE